MPQDGCLFLVGSDHARGSHGHANHPGNQQEEPGAFKVPVLHGLYIRQINGKVDCNQEAGLEEVVIDLLVTVRGFLCPLMGKERCALIPSAPLLFLGFAGAVIGRHYVHCQGDRFDRCTSRPTLGYALLF